MHDAVSMAHDLFVRLLSVSAQASVLALLIVLLQNALRNRISPGWRHALWGLLFLRLVLVWSVPASWSLSAFLHHAWQSAGTALGEPKEMLPALVPAVALPDTPALAHAAMLWMMALWGAGALATFSLAVLQTSRMGRLARLRVRVNDPEVLEILDACRNAMRVKRTIPLLSGPAGSPPALLGFLRPRLLVPAELLAPGARDRLRCVLLHELAHVRRCDVLAGWLAHLLISLHWFNPVLWWAKRRSTEDRELACDARVLSVLAPPERRAYGHALLDQIRRSRPIFGGPALVGVLGGKTSIERRIQMIAAFRMDERKGTMPALAAALLLALAGLTGAAEKAAPEPATAPAAQVPVHQETPPLLARNSPPATSQTAVPAVLPADAVVSETIAPEETVAPPVPKDASTMKQPETKKVAVAKAPEKQNKAVKRAPEPVSELQNVKTGADGSAPEMKPAPAAPAQEAADAEPLSTEPATLNSAIHEVAKDYAESLPVKSTRPGEDPPFTITVGGDILIRGNYWSNMPKSMRRNLSQNNGMEMRTRVRVCADFGQVQAVVEGDATTSPSGFYHPAGIE